MNTDEKANVKVEDIEPKIGDLLEIEIADDKKIKTRIELIQNYTIWTADFLTDIWNYKWRRQAFDVSYTKGERYFSFLTEIEGRDTIDNLAVTRMVRISNIQQIQRRASYRLPYTFDIYMRKIKDKHGNEPEEMEYTKCHGMDISETGIGLTTEDREWEVGDIVQAKFDINDEEYIFEARVMRRIVWFKDNVYIYRLGIKFYSEDEKQLKKIRRFVFAEQIARQTIDD